MVIITTQQSPNCNYIAFAEETACLRYDDYWMIIMQSLETGQAAANLFAALCKTAAEQTEALKPGLSLASSRHWWRMRQVGGLATALPSKSSTDDSLGMAARELTSPQQQGVLRYQGLHHKGMANL